MILTGILIYVLFTHFVADFVMQTHDMAINKSTSVYWLTKHIFAYAKTFLVSALVFCVALTLFEDGYGSKLALRMVVFVLINSGLHWITDYYTSKEISRLWKEKKVHDFFVMIGFDQFIHLATLLLTLYLVFTF